MNHSRREAIKTGGGLLALLLSAGILKPGEALAQADAFSMKTLAKAGTQVALADVFMGDAAKVGLVPAEDVVRLVGRIDLELEGGRAAGHGQRRGGECADAGEPVHLPEILLQLTGRSDVVQRYDNAGDRAPC